MHKEYKVDRDNAINKIAELRKLKKLAKTNSEPYIYISKKIAWLKRIITAIDKREVTKLQLIEEINNVYQHYNKDLTIFTNRQLKKHLDIITKEKEDK